MVGKFQKRFSSINSLCSLKKAVLESCGAFNVLQQAEGQFKFQMRFISFKERSQSAKGSDLWMMIWTLWTEHTLTHTLTDLVLF